MDNQIILFINSTGSRIFRAVGSDWKALIGAHGVSEISRAEMEKLQADDQALLIQLEDREMDQMEIKAPG